MIFGTFKKKKAPDQVEEKNIPQQMITFFDKNGTKMQVTKEEYKANVLPGIFERSWSDPQELYNSIVMTFEDEFLQECLEPAKRLHKIDENHERGATILGIALLKNELYQEAQQHLEKYISTYGKSGVILTNLAKAYSYQGNEIRAKEVLWESVELYPNLDNAVQWIALIARDSGGEEGYLSALEEISKIEGSWCADLWLARNDLEKDKKNDALIRYTKILKLAPENTDVLLMISGDLGKHGFVSDVMNFVYPIYNIQNHGVGPAMNLLQACAETKNTEKGIDLLSDLKELKRPDIVEHIQYYENVFANNT